MMQHFDYNIGILVESDTKLDLNNLNWGSLH